MRHPAVNLAGLRRPVQALDHVFAVMAFTGLPNRKNADGRQGPARIDMSAIRA
jgi:hypothetical protein